MMHSEKPKPVPIEEILADELQNKDNPSLAGSIKILRDQGLSDNEIREFLGLPKGAKLAINP